MTKHQQWPSSQGLLLIDNEIWDDLPVATPNRTIRPVPKSQTATGMGILTGVTYGLPANLMMQVLNASALAAARTDDSVCGRPEELHPVLSPRAPASFTAA